MEDGAILPLKSQSDLPEEEISVNKRFVLHD